MKKFFIAAMLLLGAFNSTNAQIIREGNTFKSVTSKVTRDTLVTVFKFQDSKGVLYPIIVNKANGRCWVWKKSSKSGKMYKAYMKPEVSKQVAKELGIPYIEAKK